MGPRAALQRVLGGLIVLVALAVTAAPASAATQVTPNSCKYSFDNLYRDMPWHLTSSASIVPDDRHPAPEDVVPGQAVKTAEGTFDVELPAYLAPFGYAAGLLHAGENEIGVKAWIAVKATNTQERVRVIGPVALTARTTITVDPADDNRFVSATPFEYVTPVLPELTWTAAGGDVAVGQAGPGALPPLAVGPGGAARTPAGSAVLHLTLGPATIFLDCQPGVTTGIEFDFAGPTFTPAMATTVDTVGGPENVTCLSDLGRQVTGAAANLPDGIDRELDFASAALSATGVPPEYTVGVPYTLTGTKLRAVLSGDTIATLGRIEDGGDPLVTPDTPYTVDGWVTIGASNTAEGAQTVKVQTTYTPHPSETPVTDASAWDPVTIEVALPPTTWTPTGAGPIAFRAGAPGSSDPIRVTGPASGGPGGPIVTTEFDATPYGSVVLRLATERNPAALDCLPGAARIADAGIAWSNRGRIAPPTGSLGRYGITGHPDAPVFGTARNGERPPPPPPPPPQPAGNGPGATPTPSPPGPAVRRVRPGRVGSGRVRVRKGKFALVLRCADGRHACAGTLRVRTTAKHRVGKRRRVITVVRSVRYRIAANKRKTVTLRLSRDARKLLARRSSVRVIVTLMPAAGAPVTRRVALSRPR